MLILAHSDTHTHTHTHTHSHTHTHTHTSTHTHTHAHTFPLCHVQKFLGYFATDVEAARARDLALSECKGPDAKANLPA